jgi:hypothetical protein
MLSPNAKAPKKIPLFTWSRRFAGYRRRFDIYIDLLCFAATTKLTAENEERGCGSDDHKNYDYGHDCRTAAATFIITHKIDSPLFTQDSVFTGDVIVSPP